uniref:Putative secreted peptide n=1 Tax=Anopheles braziliensis TaxID=58242 RepID=A0A2M3ZQJ8_9DIPT
MGVCVCVRVYVAAWCTRARACACVWCTRKRDPDSARLVLRPSAGHRVLVKRMEGWSPRSNEGNHAARAPYTEMAFSICCSSIGCLPVGTRNLGFYRAFFKVFLLLFARWCPTTNEKE